LHNVILQAGLGSLRQGTGIAVTKTNQLQVGAEYELYQNFVINLTYNNTKVTPGVGIATTTKTTTLDFEALL